MLILCLFYFIYFRAEWALCTFHSKSWKANQVGHANRVKIWDEDEISDSFPFPRGTLSLYYYWLGLVDWRRMLCDCISILNLIYSRMFLEWNGIQSNHIWGIFCWQSYLSILCLSTIICCKYWIKIWGAKSSWREWSRITGRIEFNLIANSVHYEVHNISDFLHAKFVFL